MYLHFACEPDLFYCFIKDATTSIFNLISIALLENFRPFRIFVVSLMSMKVLKELKHFLYLKTFLVNLCLGLPQSLYSNITPYSEPLSRVISKNF